MFRPLRDRLTIGRRNRKKYGKLNAADFVLLRYPKSGITWLRAMISQIYSQRLGIELPYLIGSSEFERRVPTCPRVFVAMDNIKLDRDDMRSLLENKKTVLLLRDPRDIAVSLYFHFCKRSTRQELLAYGIPNDIEKRGLFDFVMSPDWGLPRIISFEEYWRPAIENAPKSIVLHYEELRANTEKHLGDLMSFMGANVTPEELKDAISFASFENMRKREAEQNLDTAILSPGNVADSESFKTRKGKVGGYRDYFSDEQLKAVDELLRRTSSRKISSATS